MLYLLTFLAGMVFAAIIGFCGVKFYLKLKKRFGAIVWYDVDCFDTEPQPDGVFHMNFRLGDYIYHGYTKKCPPQGVSSEDLEVMIRTLNPKRCRYRVFWRFKNKV